MDNTVLANIDTMTIDELKEALIQKELENIELKATNKILRDEIENSKKKNPRGAGRPKKIDDFQRVQIIRDYADGESEQTLAFRYDCSVHTIKRIISEARMAGR